MTEERMRYYFKDSKGQTWEEFKKNNIAANDNYEQCCEKLLKVFINYNHHDDTPWEYFKEVFLDIPRVLRVPLMLETIYQSYKFNLTEMIEMVDEYLLSETDDERNYRVSRNKELLKNKTHKNKIVLYRGIAENCLLPNYAISYSLDKKVAEFFWGYHRDAHKSRFGFIYEMEIPIDDDRILFFSNGREEQEVFYWSEDTSEIPFLMVRGYEDSLYLTEETIEDYINDNGEQNILKVVEST